MRIKFISNRPWLNKSSITSPISTSKVVPEWYLRASRYVKDSHGNNVIDSSGGKVPSWKACPAIYDIFSTGYVLRTPCDITFYLENNKISVKIHRRYEDFIQQRSEMPDFMQPEGYRKEHFAWWPDWGISVPEGYSVLYSHPFNRFDLPFLNTNGIVDHDKVSLSGTIPFFLKENWEGTIKQGTPYVQLFPFKREDWTSEHEIIDEYEMYNANMENSIKYRVSDGGVYLNQVWSRRSYE